MEFHKLDEYDKRMLKEARDTIYAVYEFHYGDSYMRSEVQRLETIINKIDFLLDLK